MAEARVVSVVYPPSAPSLTHCWEYFAFGKGKLPALEDLVKAQHELFERWVTYPNSVLPVFISVAASLLWEKGDDVTYLANLRVCIGLQRALRKALDHDFRKHDMDFLQYHGWAI